VSKWREPFHGRISVFQWQMELRLDEVRMRAGQPPAVPAPPAAPVSGQINGISDAISQLRLLPCLAAWP